MDNNVTNAIYSVPDGFARNGAGKLYRIHPNEAARWSFHDTFENLLRGLRFTFSNSLLNHDIEFSNSKAFSVLAGSYNRFCIEYYEGDTNEMIFSDWLCYVIARGAERDLFGFTEGGAE